jgi:hypothetical protein
MRNFSILLILLSTHVSLLAQSMGINLPASTLPNTMLDVNGGVSFREGTAWVLANGINNNVALSNYSFFRVTGPTAAFSITGFTNGSDGRSLTVVNATSQTMTLSHQTGSAAINQINTGGSDINIPPNGVTTMMYNATLTKWIACASMGNLPNLLNIANGALSDSMMVVNNGLPFRVSPVSFIETYAWGLDGNGGTIDGTNFIGTTDNIPLSIRVNDQKAGRIDHIQYNTFLGYLAGNSNSTGGSNTAIGQDAMKSVTTNSYNVAIGFDAMLNATGGYNVAIGPGALESGSSNATIAIGYGALQSTTTGSGNVAIGNLAGSATTTGSSNTAVGYSSLVNNTTGSDNTALGNSTLLSNTTGNLNTAVGKWAMYGNTEGTNNTSLGAFSLHSNATGNGNVAIGSNNLYNANATGNTGLGYSAGSRLSSGNYNLLLGREAGDYMTTGSNNTVLGYQSGSLVTSGSNNTLLGVGANVPAGGGAFTNATAIGFNAIVGASNTLILGGTGASAVNVGIGLTVPNQQLEITKAFCFPSTTSSTTGVIYKDVNRFIHNYKPAANDGNNTFMGINAGNFTMSSATSWLASGNTGIGSSSLSALTEGGYNTAVGNTALQATTTGSYNTAIGSSALKTNVSGLGNTAVGNTALEDNTASSCTAVGNAALGNNTTGLANTAVGESTLMTNTVGQHNTAVGQSAMRDNTIGSYNAGLGLSAMQANTTGSYNTAIGVSSLVDNLTGNYNAALGYDALSSTTSSNNTAVGYAAGTGNTSGANNTFIGYNTGLTNVTGSSNTLLGYQANVSTAALTNATAIGANATVSASNSLVLGNNANIGIGTSSPLQTLDVNGSIGAAIRTASAATTLGTTDYTLILTGTGTFAVTLPAANTCARRIYVIVNQGASGTKTTSINYLNFSGTSVNTIAITSSMTLQSNGTSWYRIQ